MENYCKNMEVVKKTNDYNRNTVFCVNRKVN
jgi:hypothetical protein